MSPDRDAGPRDRPRLRDRLERAIARLLLRLPARALVALAGSEPLMIDGKRLDAGVHFLRVMRAKRVRFGLTEPTIAAGRARYRRDARASPGRALVSARCATSPLAARPDR